MKDNYRSFSICSRWRFRPWPARFTGAALPARPRPPQLAAGTGGPLLGGRRHRLGQPVGCDPKGLLGAVASVRGLGRRCRRPLAPGCTGRRRRIPHGPDGEGARILPWCGRGAVLSPGLRPAQRKTGCANRIFNVLRPFPVCESMPRTTWVQGLFPRRNQDKS